MILPSGFMIFREVPNKSKTPSLDDKILMEAFGLKEDEVFEARYNLLGFYGTLQKIKWRLEREGEL